MRRPPRSPGRSWVLRSPAADDLRAFTFRLLSGSEKTVGRVKGVDFVIDAPMVSRVHCRLTAQPGGRLEVLDLKSTNGTFVNGRRVTRAALTVGDRLGVGRV